MFVKTKLSLAATLVAASSVLAFAAGKVETCADQYKQCSDSANNAFYQCKARGSAPENCETAKAKSMMACDKKKADCEKKK